MRDEDLVARLPIATRLPAGTPVSKYFRNINVEAFMRNFFEDLNGSKDIDPASATFTTKYETISKDELIARRRELVSITGNAGNAEYKGNNLDELAQPDEARGFQDNSARTTDDLPTPCQSQESEEERQAQEQEAKLAALGVTGFPKPVWTLVRRSTVPATPASSEDHETLLACGLTSHHSAQSHCSQSPDEAMVSFHRRDARDAQRPNPFYDADRENYRSGSPSGRHHRNSLRTPPNSACHDSRSDNDRIVARLPSDGARGNQTASPVSARYTHCDASTLVIPESIPRDGDGRDVPWPDHTAGMRLRSDKYRAPLSGHSDQDLSRKRSNREFTAEVDEGSKRQKDEDYKMGKRKAPKVAAVYG